MTHALHALHQEAPERHRLLLLLLLPGLRMLRLGKKPGATSLLSLTKRRENACLMRRSVQSLHSSRKVLLCHPPRTGTTKATSALQIHHFRSQRKSQNRAWVCTLLRRRNSSLLSSNSKPVHELIRFQGRDSYLGWSRSSDLSPVANAPSFQEPGRGGCSSTGKSRRPPTCPAGSG